MTVLALVDNGGANLASVKNAFARLGVGATVTRDAETIRAADRIVLPGVGAAGDGMRRLRAQALDALLPTLTQPVLGVCLGMQLLFESSDENETACLGVLNGQVSALEGDAEHRVPHMGWNRLALKSEHPVLNGIDETDWFYFVHGFAAPVNNVTLASTAHGRSFAAVAGRNNFIGVQFHPERSGEAGARLLKNFLEWNECS